MDPLSKTLLLISHRINVVLDVGMDWYYTLCVYKDNDVMVVHLYNINRRHKW